MLLINACRFREIYLHFAASRDIKTWRRWAPAVLDNYMTRYLLGPHFLCR